MNQAQPNSQRFIQQAETARDLKQQLGTLAADDESEIQFTEWSPGRIMVTLWNMETGESITVPRYQALSAINIPNPAGGWMWTANQEEAPEAFVPSVPCFLHPESPHRETLRSLGINATCMTMLADEDSMEKHAARHPSRWARLKRELERRERATRDEQQQKQTDAIMALANKKGTA